MKIGVILGSTRKIRRGERVAKWLMGQLATLPNSHVIASNAKQSHPQGIATSSTTPRNDDSIVGYELLDLRDYPLPFFAEDNSPDSLENGYSDLVATKWAAKVGEMDGFILIVSEYNHGPTAVLKNALDYVYKEWNRKPVAYVGYATGASGAMRAVEQLRSITSELQMASIQPAVHMSGVLSTLDEQGNLLKGHFNERIPVVVEDLLWWAKALKTARDTS